MAFDQGGGGGGAYAAYGQQGGQQPQYNASNAPRTPRNGARSNNLSGQVPSNQMWAQAYNQAAQQYGGNTRANSFTMPGSYSSQSYNPTTGQYGTPTTGRSWDGNMAYNAIDQRPGPIMATATGIDGSQMPWQQTMQQQQAFVGNLVNRLGQYNSGQLTGPVTFDQRQLMQQANDQLANGTFYNPFAQQNQDFQRAMGNSTQYMQGDFQNPFGNSPQVNNPMPSWNQQSYDPNAQYGQPMGDPTSRSPATWSDADLQAANQAAEARARQQASAGLMDGGVRYYRDPATGKVLSDSMSGRGQDAAANWEAGEAWRAKNPTPTPVASRQPTQTSIASYPQPTDTGDFSARPGVNSPQSPAPYAIPDTDLFRNLVHKPADFGSNGQYGQPMGDALPPPRQWDYSKPYDDSADRAAASAGWKRFIEGGAYNPRNAQYWDGQGTPPWSANPGGGNQPAPQASTQGWAQPVQSPSQGTPYDPVNSQSSLPAPPAAQRPFNLRTMAKTQLPPKRKLPRPRGRGR